MDETDAIQWRRDASTSVTVRVLWSLGVGAFLAAMSIVVFYRLFELTEQVGGQSIVAAAIAAIVVTVLALAAVERGGERVARAANALPGVSTTPESGRFDRAIDAAVGAVVMAAIIGGLMAAGRVVTERELAVGAGPFTLLAASSLSFGLVAILLSSFLRSVGTFDPAEGVIHLHDPEATIDLETIRTVSIRTIGDVAVLRLRYAQPDGQYVPGPRRLVVPPAVAHEIQATARSTA